MWIAGYWRCSREWWVIDVHFRRRCVNDWLIVTFAAVRRTLTPRSSPAAARRERPPIRADPRLATMRRHSH